MGNPDKSQNSVANRFSIHTLRGTDGNNDQSIQHCTPYGARPVPPAWRLAHRLRLDSLHLSLPALRVVRVLDRLVEVRGYPRQIRVDNGPEFVGVKLAEWTDDNAVRLEFIEPGKPTQNSYVERFNRTYREEVLDSYLFSSLDEVRILTQHWISQYNGERPHKSLGTQTPLDYRAAHTRQGAKLSAAQKAG